MKPAPKARDMKARDKREAKRNASPLVTRNNFEPSTESAKYQPQLFRSFRASTFIAFAYQGRRASRCSALAPGSHIPRLRRWRDLSAPSALANDLPSNSSTLVARSELKLVRHIRRFLQIDDALD